MLGRWLFGKDWLSIETVSLVSDSISHSSLFTSYDVEKLGDKTNCFAQFLTFRAQFLTFRAQFLTFRAQFLTFRFVQVTEKT